MLNCMENNKQDYEQVPQTERLHSTKDCIQFLKKAGFVFFSKNEISEMFNSNSCVEKINQNCLKINKNFRGTYGTGTWEKTIRTLVPWFSGLVPWHCTTDPLQ